LYFEEWERAESTGASLSVINRASGEIETDWYSRLTGVELEQAR
jgi:hypothetical protein